MSNGQRRLTEGRDYRLDSAGRMIFTSAFLLARGVCCGAKCRNCPYGWENVLPEDKVKGEPQPPLDEPKTKPASTRARKRSS